jgi:arylsulfatase A-like enzyme
MPEHPFDNGDMVIRDELLDNWPRTHEAMRRYRANYYNCITHLDAHLGRLFDWLESEGALDNTVILLTGDQGLAVGSHGLLGKENMYNHSIASPLILAGPGIPAGGHSQALSHQVDLFPTLCELAAVPCPSSVEDGISLRPILQGRTERVRDAVLCQFYSPEEPGQTLRHTQRAITTERWKLTWYPQIRRFQLFDLGSDPHELVDLLAPWRVRRRQTIDANKPHWEKNAWAAPDTGPVYTQAQIADVAQDLWQRMIALMDRQQDPLPAELRPPEPNAE